jgi:hypothetical protein
MRIALLLAALLIAAACGDLQTSGALAGPASASPSVAASRTPRVTTATTLDCTVSWVSHYVTLEQLAKDAEIVVRAVAVAQDEVRLRPGFAREATRPARRTTFRVTGVLRPAGTTLTEIRVLEDVCPNLTVAPGEEWVLFAYLWKDAAANGPDEPGDHYITRGGPQGQFRIRDGKVAGPFYLFADLVHSYEGAPVAELVADTQAIR